MTATVLQTLKAFPRRQPLTSVVLHPGICSDVTYDIYRLKLSVT